MPGYRSTRYRPTAPRVDRDNCPWCAAPIACPDCGEEGAVKADKLGRRWHLPCAIECSPAALASETPTPDQRGAIYIACPTCGAKATKRCHDDGRLVGIFKLGGPNIRHHVARILAGEGVIHEWKTITGRTAISVPYGPCQLRPEPGICRVQRCDTGEMCGAPVTRQTFGGGQLEFGWSCDEHERAGYPEARA